LIGLFDRAVAGVLLAFEVAVIAVEMAALYCMALWQVLMGDRR
jgi:hypothetical protein